MGRKLAPFTRTCEACKRDYHPRADANPEKSRFCSRKCQMSIGLRYQGEDAEVSYSAHHRRVYKLHGKAADWPCSQGGCEKAAQQWACLSRDVSDLDAYVPLCISHHKKFDLARIARERNS